MLRNTAKHFCFYRVGYKTTKKVKHSMHPDLILSQQRYETCGWLCMDIQLSEESLEYSAATFLLHSKRIIFRVAKITPAKAGQFVTIWKRDGSGITTPFSEKDAFDFFVLVVRNEKQIGQFIFPKEVLLEKGIVSGKNSLGKRGMRLYAPWDKTENKQAQKTQVWQHAYFMEYSEGIKIERAVLERFFKEL